MEKLCLECCIYNKVKLNKVQREQTFNNEKFTYEAHIYNCTICGLEVPDNEFILKIS